MHAHGQPCFSWRSRAVQLAKASEGWGPDNPGICRAGRGLGGREIYVNSDVIGLASIGAGYFDALEATVRLG